MQTEVERPIVCVSTLAKALAILCAASIVLILLKATSQAEDFPLSQDKIIALDKSTIDLKKFIEDLNSAELRPKLEDGLSRIIHIPKKFYESLGWIDTNCSFNADPDNMKWYGKFSYLDKRTLRLARLFEFDLCTRKVRSRLGNEFIFDQPDVSRTSMILEAARRCGYANRTLYARFVLAWLTLGERQAKSQLHCNRGKQAAQRVTDQLNLRVKAAEASYLLHIFQDRALVQKYRMYQAGIFRLRTEELKRLETTERQ